MSSTEKLITNGTSGHANGNGCHVEEEKKGGNKYTFVQALGLNTMNMFGTGPFITIPYCLASVTPMGTHALIGYGVALVACMMDSLIWAELGSMYPMNGGSILYLKECYGADSWGRYMSFMFVWQFVISGPAECASGFISISQYLVYFSPTTVSYWHSVCLSLFLCAVTVIGLYRKVSEAGKIVEILTALTIVAVIIVVAMGFTNWDAKNMESHDIPSGFAFVWAISSATRFAIFDMTGYYDVNSMGDEVENPKRTIPLSCIGTCYLVGIVYIVVYVAVIGCRPWEEYIDMYTPGYDGVPLGIVSVITEYRTGSVLFTQIMTIIVAVTIFGSTFAQFCGYAYLLCEAGKEGYFFESLGHMSEKHEGLADNALLLTGLISALLCFFSIDQVVSAMTTLLVMVQFVGQSVGLLWLRHRNRHNPDALPAGWRMPLYPLPCYIQIFLFTLVFITTDSVLLWGSATPTLELAIAFCFLGTAMYLIRSKLHGHWPFNKSSPSDSGYVRM